MAHLDVQKIVNTARPAIPQIYAYTTPEIRRHDGWTKIGYTEQNVKKRIEQQTHTANVRWKLEWQGNATWEDGTGTFRDTDFHNYLTKLKVKREPHTEWFRISGHDSHMRFYEFRDNHGLPELPAASPYKLRSEQEQAVEKTLDYSRSHENGEFLWNAKPRFGKTLTAYDFCKRMGARKILIVTNRPAIANSWYDDYEKFMGKESGWDFISNVSSIADKSNVMTRDEYIEGRASRRDKSRGFIEFVSLQDLKGAISLGGAYDKLKEVADLEWDVLIIDEAHEGVDTLKTDVALDHINRRFTLHLSGTPFKAIANDKFPEDAIYNWTYADEQQAKRDWNNPELPNPYETLPKLNMLTYQMSDIVRDKVQKGIDLEGDETEYAFDLNEFFATDERGYFIHNDDVDKFLDALTTQKKFPFSTPELRDELRHTFWILNRVSSARALAKKLNKHPVFKNYKVVLAAGDGKVDDDDENESSFKKVRDAIAKNDYTITLSVGQLTTGVTIPEWTAVLMLSNMKSPALYMQAAFRAQNPCLFNRNGKFLRKENAYVFDFDPARTLTIFEEFANDLYTDTASGGGDIDQRKHNIRRLLNFFPVYGEDPDGEMIELDAERVLSIPRRIRSQEVVRRGFMSDFLFQNISNVFRAPAEVVEIIQQFEPYKKPDKDLGIDENTADDLSLNADGEVEIPEEKVIGKANDLFGRKVYSEVSDNAEVSEDLKGVIDSIQQKNGSDSETDKRLKELEELWVVKVTEPLVEAAKENYGEDLKPAQKRKIERKIKADVNIEANRAMSELSIQQKQINADRKKALDVAETPEEADEINRSANEKVKSAGDKVIKRLQDSKDRLMHKAGETIVREQETAKREAAKQDIETGVRDHLRGFSRTIPSFLMAYGDENTTLEDFDTIIPANVFKEVTSITVQQFRFLRDGGDFTNHQTGETEHFDGHLFDQVVFDDSVKEFIRLRTKLANYFDESLKEDIFDYVPPQKTNQIFTPKRVVKDMVDMLEKENPGCFDDPEHTFADLYMKSGLYIAEIVKRLYNSPAMKEAIPDDDERLRHIFEKQVFGIAPTEIIYQIATHFILGYNDEIGRGCDHNFVMVDSAELAKEGKLAQYVQDTFGDKLQGNDDSTEQTSHNEADNDWILATIKDAGLEYSDKRSSGGSLWVIGGNSIRGFMRDMQKKGAKFTYEPKGGSVSNNRPAWFIPASAADRAIRHHNKLQENK